MKILINHRLQMLVVTLPASSALFAQSSGTSPGQPQNQQSLLDARQIVALSVAATERSWQARDYHYIYVERDEDRRLDSRGQVKSEDVDVTRMILVNGVRFEQLIEHNGQPPSAEQEKKRREELEKLNGETPAFSMGLLVAHMQRGSHIILEQTCVGDSVWVPKRLQIRFSAKILLLKS